MNGRDFRPRYRSQLVLVSRDGENKMEDDRMNPEVRREEKRREISERQKDGKCVPKNTEERVVAW